MSNDPYGMTAKEEREIEIDAEVERLHAENARLQDLLSDLKTALMSVAMSGENSLRNNKSKWADIIIARSAYDDVTAALIKAREA